MTAADQLVVTLIALIVLGALAARLCLDYRQARAERAIERPRLSTPEDPSIDLARALRVVGPLPKHGVPDIGYEERAA